MFRKHFRIRRRLFVGLAFAALAAPAAAQAQSGVFVDGGPVPVSTTAVSSYSPAYLRYHEVGGPVGSQIRSEHSQTAATITPLQADGLRWQATARFYQSQQPTQAISERSNGVQGPNPSLVPQLALSTSNGFDWKDAGIGASTVFAAALLLGIALVLTRRHQHTGLTSA
ncbi:MAG TPA: hypothetical protein VLB89_05190 [Gaiellaceae bacterium]|nr:hypothetical protein [Gaiellaceae bacterium]